MKTNENNIKWTEYNKPFILNRADPYIYKHTDGYYYFTASVPEYDKIILRRSKTIRGLQESEEVVLWTKHETGEMSKHVWAPELYYLDNKWYIYFAAGEAENIWEIRPFVLECEDENPMSGKWVEKGKMQCDNEDPFSFQAFSLDGTVFESKGERYFVWAEKVSVGLQISNLYIAKMESPYKLKTAQVLLTTPDYDWERVAFWVNEGPAVLKRNGKIYVTYSASGTGACYCLGMMMADENSDLLDPLSWKKSRNPVLKTDSEKGIYGPGHNSFTKSEDDSRDLMIYHARPYEEIVGDSLLDPNRHTMILEVKWDEKDIPVFEYLKQEKTEF
ncbi:glycoside hydrolase family 43 protein [Anaeromicropila populeti]|uniref:Beta-xylosidase, GH43 family n=1 Tax=Anaeromicropila populeti TaxID=37658 RepID=A0A1I6LP22_9FIRM|nr:glycoside hydrolase family 43 protein [Anaeromicropila populeti]SFS05267.1 Beta-xylosidase, GH43 family [Anaeromicropila populeti]